MEQEPARHEINNQDVVKRRITPAMFPNFINHEVTLIAQVADISGNQVLLITTNEGPQVTAFLNNIGDVDAGQIIEFYGVVQDENTIRESHGSHFIVVESTENFDFETYEKAITLTHSPQYTHLFTK